MCFLGKLFVENCFLGKLLGKVFVTVVLPRVSTWKIHLHAEVEYTKLCLVQAVPLLQKRPIQNLQRDGASADA